jgi:glucose-6-phosphate 1-dehydrogenase
MTEPFAMVIFGATGDLARSKLIPALYSLFQKKQFPKDFFITGFARRELTNEEFVKMFDAEDSPEWKDFASHISYHQGTFEDPDAYKGLINSLDDLDQKAGEKLTRLFYLATPPHNYEEILDGLVSSGLADGTAKERVRVVIEKPFGKDLETAKALDKRLSEMFEESQIFRVDHYLGKETVQNMLAFRFANGIFEPVWSNKYIDHVQITWGESKGIAGRGRFFDGVGLLRDVAQNHLMQLVAAIAQEQPKSFSKESVRDARAAAIEAIRPIDPNDVSKYIVRGQYEGYQNEADVDPESDTETFLAMKLFVDTPRFDGVPFYLRAGKKLPKDVVEISVVFIQTCHILFKEYGCPEIGNVLTFHIQPDEGIGLRVIAKKPGSALALGTVDMNFTYQEEFGEKGADAYEKLLLDVFAGDQILFNRSDELESSWELITQILSGWKESDKHKLESYVPGGWGPKAAFDLIEHDNRKWL